MAQDTSSNDTFEQLSDSVQSLKASIRRELASVYTRLEGVAEQHSIPKVWLQSQSSRVLSLGRWRCLCY